MPQTLAGLTDKLLAFRDERDWRQFQGLKNLIVSLNLESAELLELTQWQNDTELEHRIGEPEFQQKLEEETADVLLYLLMICERAGIDLGQAASKKIAINAAKYPIEKARGNAKKYTKL